MGIGPVEDRRQSPANGGGSLNKPPPEQPDPSRSPLCDASVTVPPTAHDCHGGDPWQRGLPRKGVHIAPTAED